MEYIKLRIAPARLHPIFIDVRPGLADGYSAIPSRRSQCLQRAILLTAGTDFALTVPAVSVFVQLPFLPVTTISRRCRPHFTPYCASEGRQRERTAFQSWEIFRVSALALA